MAQKEREYFHLSTLEYMEFRYFDDAGNPCDKEKATKCIIYEYDKEDNLLRKTNGTVKAKFTEDIAKKLLSKGKKFKVAVKKRLPDFILKD